MNPCTEPEACIANLADEWECALCRDWFYKQHEHHHPEYDDVPVCAACAINDALGGAHSALIRTVHQVRKVALDLRDAPDGVGSAAEAQCPGDDEQKLRYQTHALVLDRLVKMKTHTILHELDRLEVALRSLGEK